jgi:two-component system chemotaxis response regulator CheB
MFRSAALAYGARVIGVILTGSLDDGTSGLLAIKRRGGIAVAQDPEDAMFPSMPQSAIEHVAVDHVARLEDLPRLLADLTKQPIIEEATLASDDAEKDIQYAELDLSRIENADAHPGVLAPFGCPDCGGTLWELREGDLVRFRCRVGHAWTSDGLLASQSETLDAALWTALRALEESASLRAQLAERARARGNARLAERMGDNAELALRRARTIREVLTQDGPQVEDESQDMVGSAQRMRHGSSPRERTAGD